MIPRFKCGIGYHGYHGYHMIPTFPHPGGSSSRIFRTREARVPEFSAPGKLEFRTSRTREARVPVRPLNPRATQYSIRTVPVAEGSVGWPTGHASRGGATHLWARAITVGFSRGEGQRWRTGLKTRTQRDGGEVRDGSGAPSTRVARCTRTGTSTCLVRYNLVWHSARNRTEEPNTPVSSATRAW